MSEEGRFGRLAPALACLLSALALAGCGGRAGFAPPPLESVADPRQIVDFEPLYSANCSGCHGGHGQGGLALGLASPGYLALASDSRVREVIANGRPSTAMPAFARGAGGLLSEAQVDALVSGIRAWAPRDLQSDPRAPALELSGSSDARRGAHVFRARCASCHGNDGRGGGDIASIVDDSFLALVSAPSIATTVVAGRPDLGCPDWRGKGEPAMSNAEVADAVAWLLAQRAPFPGRPYPGEPPPGPRRR
ncbi:MAG: c-type cytochrome [Polyangiaceae bacterium]